MRLLMIILSLAVIMAAAANGLLIFDDLSLVDLFNRLSGEHGFLETSKIIFFGIDGGSGQYRTFGLSRLSFFWLWYLFGSHGSAWATLIAITQVASGWALYKILRNIRCNEMQSRAVCIVWTICPFAMTSCFLFFSFLILPYQLTLACALCLQMYEHTRSIGWIAASVVLGLAIAMTGESHYFAAPAIIILVALATPSNQSFRNRWTVTFLPLVALGAALVLYRCGWSSMVGTAIPITPTRFVFELPPPPILLQRSTFFLRSLVGGLELQVLPVMFLAGAWFWVCLLGAAVILMLITRAREPSQPHQLGAFALSGGLAVVFLTSLIVFALLTILAGGDTMLNRRYGYVPYTLLAMTIVALIGEPAIGKPFQVASTALALLPILSLSTALQLVCIPKIRSEDAELWTIIKSHLAERPNVLFSYGWGEANASDVEFPGLRGSDFPRIFESPFSAFWWESQYAVEVVGANYAGFHGELKGERILLFGTGHHLSNLYSAPVDTVTIVKNPRQQPQSWTEPFPDGITVEAFPVKSTTTN